MTAKKASTKKAPARRTVASVQRELDEFKNTVTEAVMSFDDRGTYGGIVPCEERAEFLRSIGLKAPAREGEFVVNIRFTASDEDEAGDAIQGAVDDALAALVRSGDLEEAFIDSCDFVGWNG